MDIFNKIFANETEMAQNPMPKQHNVKDQAIFYFFACGLAGIIVGIFMVIART